LGRAPWRRRFHLWAAGGACRRCLHRRDGEGRDFGRLTAAGTTDTTYVATVNANGTLDTGFTVGTGVTGGSANVTAIARQSDGNILIGGEFTSYNGTGRTRVARLNTDGTLDTSFDPGTGASSQVDAIAVQSNGRILIGGQFLQYNGANIKYVVRVLN
jgi:hypothetical protein